LDLGPPTDAPTDRAKQAVPSAPGKSRQIIGAPAAVDGYPVHGPMAMDATAPFGSMIELLKMVIFCSYVKVLERVTATKIGLKQALETKKPRNKRRFKK